jgi:hypothetical protein
MIWQIARLDLRQSWRAGSASRCVHCDVRSARFIGWISHDRLTAATSSGWPFSGKSVELANQPDRHPHRVAHYGYLVFRPRPR